MATMSINATTERGGNALRARLSALPWLTAVPLAVVLAFADGFWMIALRGSVGSIERTQEPFASWLRESILTLPIFILAVLAALALAGWLKPSLPGWRRLLATALLVVVAGTVVGVAELTVSSAYDYRLQSAQIQEKAAAMGSPAAMGSKASVAGTTAEQQHASAGLQMRAVGYGSGILLVTNLVLVGWVVAMRGGRLKVRAT